MKVILYNEEQAVGVGDGGALLIILWITHFAHSVPNPTADNVTICIY